MVIIIIIMVINWLVLHKLSIIIYIYYRVKDSLNYIISILNSYKYIQDI